MFDRLRYYDVQITLVLNPLNWEMDYHKYWKGLKSIRFGPIQLMLYYGG